MEGISLSVLKEVNNINKIEESLEESTSDTL